MVGASHRSAPVALLERLSLDEAGCRETAKELTRRSTISEALVLSTCNRFEVYVTVTGFHPGVRDVVSVLHDATGVDGEELREHVSVRYACAAAEHLMTVTSGLDSMVVGEQQIIGQVRTAYRLASEAGTLGPVLHALTQAALRAGKRVHAETDVDEAAPSMVSYALDQALGAGEDSAAGRTALVLGAGAMASLAATELGRRGIRHLLVANRTRERAERLAAHAREAGVSAEAVDYPARHLILNKPEAVVSVVVSATGARDYTLSAARLADIPGGPQAVQRFFVDLSMPRDIDPELARRPHTTLINIEELQSRREGEKSPLAPAQAAATAIVADELSRYASGQRVKEVAPAVTALRRHAAEVTNTELEQLRARVPSLSESELDAVERTLHRVVDKLLHQPTVRAKELALRSSVLTYDAALPVLFGLDEYGQHATEQDRSVSSAGRNLPRGDFSPCGVVGCRRLLQRKETA